MASTSGKRLRARPIRLSRGAFLIWSTRSAGACCTDLRFSG